jgi:aspartyl-tRNA(Asn)/glutamyl-tRNA(Gln) amidotransferase subunit B
MPELPATRRTRYLELGIKSDDAETLVGSRALAMLFEQASEKLSKKEEMLLAGNYLTSDLVGLIKKAKGDADSIVFPFTSDSFAELIRMVSENKLSSRGAKNILQALFEGGGSPAAIAEEGGLLQRSDAGELETVVKEIIAGQGKVVEDYKNGKMPALQFLVGLGMKATKGAANPSVLRELFVSLLK